MGYYIYHKKAVLEKHSDLDISSMEITSEIDQNLFDKYIQKIQFKKPVNSIIILNDYDLYEKEKLRLKDNLVFHNSEQKLIDKLIKKNGYNNLIKEVFNGYDGRTIYEFFETEEKDGIYTKNIFEHPFKNCSNEFYKKYPTGPIYTKLNVFIKACELEYEEWRFPDKEDFYSLIKLFEKNLVENYEEGKSILFYC